MRRNGGIFRSTLVTVISGIVVGTAVTVNELRLREQAERPIRAADLPDKPRVVASRLDPGAFIPGFTPDKDIETVLEILDEYAPLDQPSKPLSRPKHQAGAQEPKRGMQAPVTTPSRTIPDKGPSVSEQIADSRLSLHDLEALQQRLMSYAEGYPAKDHVAEAQSSEIHPALDSETRVVAVFMVAKPDGPKLLVCVRDRWGAQVHELRVDSGLASRIAESTASAHPEKPYLLLLLRFLAP